MFGISSPILPIPELDDDCPECGDEQVFQLDVNGSTKKPWLCDNCGNRFSTAEVTTGDTFEELEDYREETEEDEIELLYE